MKAISKLLFLFMIHYSISGLNGESIFINPALSNKTFNFINYKIIILSNQISQHQKGNLPPSTEIHFYNVLNYYDKLLYNSYILSPNFFAFIDNLNIKYFIFENKLYKYEELKREMNPIEPELASGFIFIDYFVGKPTNQMQKPNSRNIIIYGKEGEQIVFYYIDSNSKILINTELENIDTDISCKLIELSEVNIFICIYSQNNSINLSILYYNKNNNILKIVYNYNETTNIFFSEINESILYDTNDTNFKIICGRMKNNIGGDIKCILVNPTIHKKDNADGNIEDYFKEGNFDKLVFKINFYNISEINTTFSFNENNCNYTMFKSEYLICCGNIGVIICERRDIKLKLIDSFNLTFPGNIKNLTLENNNDTYVELLYYNETLESNNTYEYHIYPPKCKNINITSINNRSSFIDLDGLFDRETNTNYYITIKTSSCKYLEIDINNNTINRENEKINLDLNNNFLKYEIKNDINTIKNLDINYTISINETYYSDMCTISIIFCYFSCEECTLREENPNALSHYCHRCKPNYLSFGKGNLNCFNEEEIEKRNMKYFVIEEHNTHYECDSECQKCIRLDGSYNLVKMKDNLLIIESECLENCLIETINIQNDCDRLKECQNCTSKCGVWEKENTSWVINPSISNVEIEPTLYKINNTISNIEISSSKIELGTNKMDITESDIKPKTSNMILLTTINEQTTNDMKIKISTSKLDYSTQTLEPSIKETEPISTSEIEYSTSKMEVTTNNIEYSSSKIDISKIGIKEEEYSTTVTNIKESSISEIENLSSEIKYFTSKYEVTTNNIEDSSSYLDKEKYSTTITDTKESIISNLESFTSKIDVINNNIEYSTSNLDSSIPKGEENIEYIKESSFNMESSSKVIDNFITSNIQSLSSYFEPSSSKIEHITSNIEISTSKKDHSISYIESSISNIENSEPGIQNSNSKISTSIWNIDSSTSNLENESTLIETNFTILIVESTNNNQINLSSMNL